MSGGSDRRVAGYEQLLADVARQRSALEDGHRALDRARRALAEREGTLLERELRIRAAEEELDHRRRSIASREKDVQELEALSHRRPLPSLAGAHRVSPPPPPTEDEAGRRPLGSVGPGGPTPPEVAGAPWAIGREVGPALTFLGQRLHRFGDRLPTGNSRLDDLLLGGLPPRSHVVLVGDAFVGKEVALYSFIAEGLRRSEPALLVTANRTSREVARSLGLVMPGFDLAEQRGQVVWVDASGNGTPEGQNRFAPRDPDDTSGLLASLDRAARTAVAASPHGRFRVGFLGLSAVLAHHAERENFQFLQSVLGVLKPLQALAMYALEAGALTEHQVESFLGRMDGAVLFRQDRGRTLLSVKGFGQVATREWVECRATDRELILGSFALERIR